jgi:hypothetical protein
MRPIRAVPIAALLVAVAATPAAAVKAHAPLGPAVAGVTVSPQPGTPDAMPQTQISILGVQPQQLSKVTVVGSKTGRHSGRLHPYSNNRGASFIPRTPFTPGEQVGVSFSLKGAVRTSHVAFHFVIGSPGTSTAPFLPPPPENLIDNAQQFVTRPDLHPTNVIVTARVPGVAPGYAFVAPIRGPGPPGPMYGQFGVLMLDGNGSPAWFRPAPAGQEDFNFGVQTYDGSPVLTWWEGQLAPVGVGSGVNLIYDDHYRQVAVVKAGNGLTSDLHDFIITPQNTALIMAYQPINKDLTPYGGAANATMFDSVLQEIDIKTGLVMWEWHHLGHMDPADAESAPQVNQTWDPFHINSVQVLANGNIVISDRNTWGIYQINKATGHLIWRLGGKKSTFALGPGARFTWQHDARFNATSNTVSLFDDEAAPATATQSRGLVLKLDPVARTAILAHEYTHPEPQLLTGSQGNMQVLPNGNMFVGWGAQPFLTEYTSDGQLLFDAHFVAPIESYRAFRFDWAGKPPSSPAFVAKAGPTGTTLYASWNGDTETASWQFLSGASPTSLSVVAVVPRSGFETSTTVQNAGPYFAVRATTASGRVLSQSPVVTSS